MLRLVLTCASLLAVQSQRPSFAGRRPIGYPELINRTTTEALGNRFGEGDATTQKLPLEALGDRDLVERLSKLPLDKQPFWLLNWNALENHRKNPQTYPQRQNSFIEPLAFIDTSNNTNATTTNILINRSGGGNNVVKQNLSTVGNMKMRYPETNKEKKVTKDTVSKKVGDGKFERKNVYHEVLDKYDLDTDFYDDGGHFSAGFGSVEDSHEILK